jgi:short-subunit dehydrogenase
MAELKREGMSERNRVLLIGASSGMGRALALRYAERGDIVGITGRRLELLEEIRLAYPDRIHILAHDIRAMDNPERLNRLVEEMGGMNLCIICAGIGIVHPEIDWNIDEQTMDTNVRAFTQICHWAFDYFSRRKVGHLANISSVSSYRGNSFAPAYSASKAYQSNYLEGLHMKAQRLGLDITVSDILPGFVQTKPTQGNKRFWVSTVDKAATQIQAGLDAKKFRFYVSRRWALIAWAMKWIPDFVYHRVG